MTPDIGLGNWMYQRALRSPERKALSFEGQTWTYAQLQDRIDRLASALKAQGLCQGDRLGFLGLNQPAFFETLFAAARLGAIFVPLNFRLTGADLGSGRCPGRGRPAPCSLISEPSERASGSRNT